MRFVFKIMKSPVGFLKLVASETSLAAVLWEGYNPLRVRLPAAVEVGDNEIIIQTVRQLGEYFAGERREFSLPLAFVGTAFQEKVWQALLTIPYGETRSYRQIAAQMGNEKAVRAVGAANGKNPISIIAPCHRVIGAGGQLTGFAGGLKNKALLLDLEKGQLNCPAELPLSLNRSTSLPARKLELPMRI